MKRRVIFVDPDIWTTRTGDNPMTDNPGVDHFSLPSDPGVLGRLITHLGRQRSHCG